MDHVINLPSKPLTGAGTEAQGRLSNLQSQTGKEGMQTNQAGLLGI